MSKVLIIKLGAAGDVVRTTPIMNLFLKEDVDWLVLPSNAPLLAGTGARVLSLAGQIPAAEVYDLVISLEEDREMLDRAFATFRFKQVIGTYPASDGKVRYTPEVREWFDMSLIGSYGVAEANRLKLANRRSYQAIIFEALGAQFSGEEYILPPAVATGLCGDIALVTSTGDRWPNKQWGHWPALAGRLDGLCTVNLTPRRHTVLEHLGDINNHRIIITPDSLPLHLGIGLQKTTIGIFNCTSPWEIYPYRRMTPIVSPCLEKYFYTTGFVREATVCLSPDEVYRVVASALFNRPNVKDIDSDCR